MQIFFFTLHSFLFFKLKDLLEIRGEGQVRKEEKGECVIKGKEGRGG